MALSENFIGRTVVLEYSPAGTSADDPTLLTDYQQGVFLTSKSVDPDVQTVENTNDDSKGVSSNLITRLNWSASADYYLDADPVSPMNVLYRDVLNAVVAGDQPRYWIRIRGPKYPHVIYAYCIVSPGSNDNGTDDVSSGTFDFNITDTDRASEINPFQIYARVDA